MKTHQLFHINFSKGFLLVAAFSSLAFLSTSCKSEDEVPSENSLSEEDAANTILLAMSSSTGGLTGQMETVNEVSGEVSTTDPNGSLASETVSFSCGIPQTNSLNGSSDPSATLVYNYDYEMSWVVNCKGKIPSTISFSLLGSSEYESPRMSSSDEVSIVMEVSDIDLINQAFVMTLDYERFGNQQSLINANRNFSSNLAITSSGLYLSRDSGKVTGTAQAEISGKLSSGEEFAYGGTVTFTESQVTVTLNSGIVYSFDR